MNQIIRKSQIVDVRMNVFGCNFFFYIGVIAVSLQMKWNNSERTPFRENTSKFPEGVKKKGTESQMTFCALLRDGFCDYALIRFDENLCKSLCDKGFPTLMG